MALTKPTSYMVAIICGLTILTVGLLIGVIVARREVNDLKATAAELRSASPAPSNLFESYEPTTPASEKNVNQAEVEDESSLMPWEREVRLPRSVLPKHYDLYLHPNLQLGTFAGKVSIDIQSQDESRDYFLTHIKQLDILEATMTDQRGDNLDMLEVFESKKNEFLVFKPKRSVPKGNYTMHIEFKGNLTNGITGFYQSVYTNEAGERVPIATSKFQPTDARKAFPCFDEPSFKSTFSTTLVRPSERYIALSNMPEAHQTPDAPSSGLTEVKFEKSVPMVTYLACFIVCDFEHAEKLTAVHNTRFRVFATPEAKAKDRIQYALDIGANITDYFENYFEIAYPLPKQDMIAIPDFVSGAMEHWGLITYRETKLLFNEQDSSSADQVSVARVVSHELAHQWFGNLVTTFWWDDLWLNEGFASYIEFKGVSQYHTDWNYDETFLYKKLHGVMDLDATLNSHPIVQPVDHPDQITELFDKITYHKGASVLRMLENFMGPENFRLGIKRFLQKYSYQTAVTAQLWTELESVVDLNVTRIMDTWTRQMGYPVLTVEKVKDRLYRLTQSRFLADPSKLGQGETSPFDYKWDIYVTYRQSTSPDTVESQWMKMEDGRLDISLPSETDWVKFNVDQAGFYRVNYPPEQWAAFAQLLMTNHTKLSAMDRASLINDAFSLSSAGMLDYSIALSMLSYLKDEKSYTVWSTAIKVLDDLDDRLADTASYPLFKRFVSSLVEGHYERLGWDDVGSLPVRLNRVHILTIACGLAEHPKCLKAAERFFTEWIEDSNLYIPPNLRQLIYKCGVKVGGDEENWNVMLDRYAMENNAHEKRKLIKGIARISKPWLIKRFLNLAKNETLVRGQDYLSALTYLSYNSVAVPILWNFIREEWPYLTERFTLNNRYLGRMPKIVSSTFSTQLQLEEMESFFEKYPEAGAGKRARKQALENIENNIRWLARNEDSINSWLESNDRTSPRA